MNEKFRRMRLISPNALFLALCTWVDGDRSSDIQNPISFSIDVCAIYAIGETRIVFPYMHDFGFGRVYLHSPIAQLGLLCSVARVDLMHVGLCLNPLTGRSWCHQPVA